MRSLGFDVKGVLCLNPLSSSGLTLKDWPEANASFLEIEKSVSIPVKLPKLFQVLLSFPSSTRTRGLFCSARVCEEVLRFLSSLAEKRESLEGVRERGFNAQGLGV